MHWLLRSRLTWFFISVILSQKLFCQKFSIDQAASKIEFSVTHLGVLEVNGNFANFSGLVQFNKTKVTVSGIINANSINTGNEDRDKIIRSDGYLNVSVYPKIQFSARGTVTKDSIIVEGPLRICGASKILKLKCGWKDKQLKCATSIKRSDFKLDFGGMNALIGDEVLIRLTFYLKLPKSSS